MIVLVELVQRILSFLEISDLVVASRVCLRWAGLGLDMLWWSMSDLAPLLSLLDEKENANASLVVHGDEVH
jgi:hypothetical protein